ncbi:MAG: site-2 protease family protein [Phycisphaeraceae bacterium]|nr:site-2 protease family protein [Phycisphaeraceae bacterium]
MGWWLAVTWESNPVWTVSWIVWVIGSIILHELGHGIAAIRCGDDTPRELGHMTWNPLVHMGPMALIMFALFGFTWGMMPVNPYNFRGRYDDALVAFAGPLVNIVLFVLCTVCAVVWVVWASAIVPDPLWGNVSTFLWTGMMINMMGFCFNMIPMPPLDGSRILGSFVPEYARLWQGEQGAVIGLVVFAAIFFYGASRIWDFVITVSREVLHFGVRLVSSGTPAPTI